MHEKLSQSTMHTRDKQHALNTIIALSSQAGPVSRP